jgi:hypothetical protein
MLYAHIRFQVHFRLTSITQIRNLCIYDGTERIQYLEILFPARCFLGRPGIKAVFDLLKKISGSSNLVVLVLQVNVRRSTRIPLETLTFPSLCTFRTSLRHTAVRKLLSNPRFAPMLVDLDVGPCRVRSCSLQSLATQLCNSVKTVAGPALCAAYLGASLRADTIQLHSESSPNRFMKAGQLLAKCNIIHLQLPLIHDQPRLLASMFDYGAICSTLRTLVLQTSPFKVSLASLPCILKTCK